MTAGSRMLGGTVTGLSRKQLSLSSSRPLRIVDRGVTLPRNVVRKIIRVCSRKEVR